MKNKHFVIFTLIFLLFGVSCSDKWDEHYSKQDTVIDNEDIEISDLSAQKYIQSNSDLSSISQLFTEEGIFSDMDKKDQSFTVLVYNNSKMTDATIEDASFFAQTCICNLALTPTKLTDGASIQMWNGKYLAISLNNTEAYIAESNIYKIVEVNNGYIYFMEDPIYAPKSLYEVLEELGDNYSLFKELVFSFEEKEFDKENSTPVGVDNTGNTIYDSVFVTKNTLMDRYNSGGTATWNMRSEYFTSTMLIPSNNIIQTALDKAYDDIQESLNRTPTESDSTKFKEWIVRSCFYDTELTSEELDGDEDIYSVAGYLEDASASTDGTQWKPSVQKVNTASPIELSNGVAYYITSLKIPNNVVIHRIKNRFYIWENCSADEKETYFKWTNLEETDIYDNGSFGPIGSWPKVYYKCLRSVPTEEATNEKLPVSIEYTGISLNNDGTISEVKVPPGEYYLRMGFKSSNYAFLYDIYFNDDLVAESVGPNIHYDRTGIGWPEGYVWRDWYSTTTKARYYDCDGGNIATVTVTGDELQGVKLKLVSNDMTQASGSKNIMVLYCWTLRPTENNY